MPGYRFGDWLVSVQSIFFEKMSNSLILSEKSLLPFCGDGCSYVGCCFQFCFFFGVLVGEKYVHCSWIPVRYPDHYALGLWPTTDWMIMCSSEQASRLSRYVLARRNRFSFGCSGWLSCVLVGEMACQSIRLSTTQNIHHTNRVPTKLNCGYTICMMDVLGGW